MPLLGKTSSRLLLSTMIGGPLSGGGGYEFTNAEAETYVAAMSSQPDDTRKALIDTLFTNLKSGTVNATNTLAELDLLYLLAAHDSQAARLNAITPASFALTAVNSPTFTADQGYASNGTSSYLDTGFSLETDGTNYILNDAHISIWSRTDQQDAGVDIGARDGSGDDESNVIIRNASDQGFARLNTDDIVDNVSVTNSSGHFLGVRTNSTQSSLYRNGAIVGSAWNANSGAETNSDCFICARNTAGTPGNYTTRQYSIASVGGGMTANQIADFYAALNAYIGGL